MKIWIIILFLLIPFAFAIGYDNPNLPRVTAPTSIGVNKVTSSNSCITINPTTGNVVLTFDNASCGGGGSGTSVFSYNHTIIAINYVDTHSLNLSGTNANQDLNLNNFKVSNISNLNIGDSNSVPINAVLRIVNNTGGAILARFERNTNNFFIIKTPAGSASKSDWETDAGNNILSIYTSAGDGFSEGDVIFGNNGANGNHTNLHIDNANKRLSVNRAKPRTQLDVNGTGLFDTLNSTTINSIENVTSKEWFNGLFRWIFSPSDNLITGSFNGSTLQVGINSTNLNKTIDQRQRLHFSETGETRISGWNGAETFLSRGINTDTSAFGTSMNCNGSIIGMGSSVQVTSLGSGQNLSIQFRVKINNTISLTSSTGVFNGTGTRKGNNQTSEGVYNFTEFDYIQLSVLGSSPDITIPTTTSNPRITYQWICKDNWLN